MPRSTSCPKDHRGAEGPSTPPREQPFAPAHPDKFQTSASEDDSHSTAGTQKQGVPDLQLPTQRYFGPACMCFAF